MKNNLNPQFLVNNKIISSAKGQIKQLFLHYQGYCHQLEIIKKFLLTVSKGTDVIILLGDKQYRKKVEKHFTKLGLSNFQLRFDERMYLASKWLRDPFVIVEGANTSQIHLVEPGLQKMGDEDVAEVIQRELRNASVVQDSCFVIDGGNVLADEDFVMLGANQFSKFLCCLKERHDYTSQTVLIDKAKEYVRSSFGLPQSHRVICVGDINWGLCFDQADASLKENESLKLAENIFSTELWFEELFPDIDVLTFDKILYKAVEGKNPKKLTRKQKNEVLDSIKMFIEDTVLPSKGFIDGAISDIIQKVNQKLKNIKLSEIELRSLIEYVTGNRGPLVHIDLFITLTGLKVDGKYLVFLAEACLTFPKHQTPKGIVKHRDKINYYLSRVHDQLTKEGFYIERLKMPIIHKKGSSNWRLGIYCNSLVENINGNVKIWYPKLSTSELFYKASPWGIRSQLAEIEEEMIHLFQKYQIKSYGIQSSKFSQYIKAFGAIHCITKETRFNLSEKSQKFVNPSIMQTEFYMGQLEGVTPKFVKDAKFKFSINNLTGELRIEDASSSSPRVIDLTGIWIYMQIDERGGKTYLELVNSSASNFVHSVSVVTEDRDTPDFLPMTLLDKVSFIGTDDVRVLLDPVNVVGVITTVYPNTTLFRIKHEELSGDDRKITIEY